MDLNQFMTRTSSNETSLDLKKLLDTFLALGAKTYKSTSIWEKTVTVIDVLPVDGKIAKLVPETTGPGWQLQLNLEGQILFAEIVKEDRPAAANGYPQWKIDHYIASEDFRAVALSNGTIVTVEEFEKNKVALEAAGIVKATTLNGKPRADGGDIFIPKFDPSKPAKEQEKSFKFVASKV